MHIVLCGLSPSFQHIRNGYVSAEKQGAATLLHSNHAMSSAASLLAIFTTQASHRHSHQAINIDFFFVVQQ